MAADEDTDASDGLPLTKPLRTVTPGSRPHHDESMDAIGWGMLAGLLILLVPLLPFIVIVWLISKVAEAVSPTP